MSQGAIAVPLEGRPMSLAEWADLPEDEPGELVDGRLVEDEVSDAPHEVVVSWLIVLLGLWLRGRNGRVLGSDAKFAVAPRRGRRPDISIYFSRDHKLPRRGALRVPPDVIVEVVSSPPRDGRRDRVEKVGEYAAFGARWYWIVDPRLRTVEILGLGGDGHYSIEASVSEGVLLVPGCEGLELDIDALWRELDESIEGGAGEEPTSSD